MKTKSKFFKIFLPTFIVVAVIITSSLIIWKFIKTSSVDIVNDNTEVPIDGKDKEAEKLDFVNTNHNIDFKENQKMYMLDFDFEQTYFVLTFFKYYFMLEFQKLGPTNENISLVFSIDSPNKTRSIKATYQGAAKIYDWNYTIINI